MSKINKYNAVGAPESSEATEEKETFKKGGKVKKKAMKVKGEKSAHRLDKAKRAAGGRSPFSTAEKVKTEATDPATGKGTTPNLGVKVYARGGHVKAHPFHNKASKHHGG